MQPIALQKSDASGTELDGWREAAVARDMREEGREMDWEAKYFDSTASRIAESAR